MMTERIDRGIEWVVGRISPKAAIRRRHYRLLASDETYRESIAAIQRVRGYRWAKGGINSGPWSGVNQSADNEVSTDLSTMRQRSRELNRDDSIASGLTLRFKQEVVGTGIRPRVKMPVAELAQAVHAVWKDRQHLLFPVDGADWGMALRLVFGKVLEDGDVFVKAAKAAPGEPVWFEIIEGDRCVSPTRSKAEGGGWIQDGVERMADGRVAAYWFRGVEKGTGLGALASKMAEPIRYEASLVKHVKLQGRPGQTRGVPLFHAIGQELRDLDLLVLASLKRTQVAACLAAFVTSELGAEEVMNIEKKTNTLGANWYEHQDSLTPGMIMKLLPGEKIDTLIPNFPVPELVPFIFLIARRIGVALGISWQEVLRDFSNASYSSARTDKLDCWRTYDIYQEWLIVTCLTWIWDLVLQDAYLRGDDRLAGLANFRPPEAIWIPDGRRWVDPAKEALAIKEQLAMGLTTLRDECAALGVDWEDNLAQLAVERQRREVLGLPEFPAVPVAPGQVAGSEIESEFEEEQAAKPKPARVA